MSWFLSGITAKHFDILLVSVQLSHFLKNMVCGFPSKLVSLYFWVKENPISKFVINKTMSEKSHLTSFTLQICKIFKTRHLANFFRVIFYGAPHERLSSNFDRNFIQTELLSHLQKQLPDVFYKKDVLKHFTKFTGKHLCQSLFLRLRPATLLKKTLWHSCFP